MSITAVNNGTSNTVKWSTVEYYYYTMVLDTFSIYMYVIYIYIYRLGSALLTRLYQCGSMIYNVLIVGMDTFSAHNALPNVY